MGRQTTHQTIWQIIGQPGSGKTTLVAALVRHFTGQGLAVGTIKIGRAHV